MVGPFAVSFTRTRLELGRWNDNADHVPEMPDMITLFRWNCLEGKMLLETIDLMTMRRPKLQGEILNGW